LGHAGCGVELRAPNVLVICVCEQERADYADEIPKGNQSNTNLATISMAQRSTNERRPVRFEHVTVACRAGTHLFSERRGSDKN
jgi:hypothetical protein